MSQDYDTLPTSSLLSTWKAIINASLDALLTLHIGATRPAYAVAGMPWICNTTPSASVWTLAVYDGTQDITIGYLDTGTGAFLIDAGSVLTGDLDADSNKVVNLDAGVDPGDAVNKGQVDTRVQTLVIPIGSQSAAFDRFLLVASGTQTIVQAYVLAGTTIDADGSNYWTLQIRNVTAGANLLTTPASTAAVAITADTARALTPDAALTPSSGDVLQLQVTKTGSPTAFDAETCLVLTYTVAT